ncbi:MAG: sigma-70 family RNA polymerase sigma factor [Planctomycetaceae bacterium]|nr:sigma-70 family RNA polymerase sigma factor [Planctomycetaceae bacterium]MDC0273622.1 sigma-70 family RNA polymerase sigma factor [Planctomycetaceae bacterium]MDG2387803.1 sigma-70 family RNA polymerase sigma factor [Planctomycetaceae bacterium]
METYILRELVLRAQAGSRDAFDTLVEHFEPTVFAIVLRRLRNRAEASEVAQEVFLRAFRKLDQLREPERFAGWLKQIAVRLAINRAVRRPQEFSTDNEVMSAVADQTPETPLDSLLRAEQREGVWEGLHRLGDMDRETLISFYINGHSLKEMSEEFGSPIGTIKRRLHTARHRLRDELLAQPA